MFKALNTTNPIRMVALLILSLALLFIALIYLPVASMVAQFLATDSGQFIDGHKKIVVLLLAASIGIIAVWLLLKMHFRTLKSVIVAVAVMLVGVSAYLFQTHFPRADLLSIGRINDSLAIMLGKDIRLSKFEPETQLITKRTVVERAAFPVIDVHFHLSSLPKEIDADRLIAAMDAAGIEKIVNLDGSPSVFDENFKKFHAKYPERILMFVKPDIWSGVKTPDGIAQQVKWIREAASRGAVGLKVSKSLGFDARGSDGKLIAIDDPRLNPIWAEAARLGMPVLMHTADPPAFFKSISSKNERYEELSQYPEWSYYGSEFPTFANLMTEREHVLANNPNTKFIGAHIGNNEDDLAYAGSLLDKYPNYYVDMSSRVAGLGRQPYSTREFFIKYQDRILFGSDGGYGLQSAKNWTPERFYRSYIEFLETSNEAIDYPLQGTISINGKERPFTQGRWKVTAINLPKDVLEKLYKLNAEKLIPHSEQVRTRLLETAK